MRTLLLYLLKPKPLSKELLPRPTVHIGQPVSIKLTAGHVKRPDAGYGFVAIAQVIPQPTLG